MERSVASATVRLPSWLSSAPPTGIPPPVNFTVTLGGNTIYAPNGSAVVQYGPTVPFQAFQAEGYDAGSVVNATVPDAPTIIAWAQALLGAGAH